MSRSKRFIPVSTRLALRRKRKKDRAQQKQPPIEDDDLTQERRMPSEDPIFDWQPSAVPFEEKKPRSFWNALFGMFKREPPLPPADRGAPPPSEDPLREILAHPKGPARFDAFETHLARLQAGTPGHRTVALAFHQELCTLAKTMDVNLRLLESRVEKCADGLALAGEKERAGELLALLGFNDRAAELFVEVGAVEQLQEVHFDRELEAGPKQFDAQMIFDKAMGEFATHQRERAFELIAKARSMAPQNRRFQQVSQDWERRRLTGCPVALETIEHRFIVHPRLPIHVGRGEESVIPFRRPRFSRVHFRIDQNDSHVELHPLVSPSLMLHNDMELTSALPIAPSVQLTCAGAALELEHTHGLLRIVAEDFAQDVFFFLTEPLVHICVKKGIAVPTPGPGVISLQRNAHDSFVVSPSPHITHDGSLLQHPLLLLHADRICVEEIQLSVNKA